MLIGKPTDNTVYMLSIALLCVLTYLLNYCTKISQCALIFVIIAATVNVATAMYGKVKALKGLTSAIIISFFLLWKLPYYIQGQIVNGITVASLISVMISMYCASSIFQKRYHQSQVVTAGIVSIAVATIVDGLIMSLFFILNSNFSYAKVFNIFLKECSYKLLYGLAVSAILAVTVTLLKKQRYSFQN